VANVCVYHVVLPPISTIGLTAADVPELVNRTRELMLSALKEISAPSSIADTMAQDPPTPTPPQLSLSEEAIMSGVSTIGQKVELPPVGLTASPSEGPLTPPDVSNAPSIDVKEIRPEGKVIEVESEPESTQEEKKGGEITRNDQEREFRASETGSESEATDEDMVIVGRPSA